MASSEQQLGQRLLRKAGLNGWDAKWLSERYPLQRIKAAVEIMKARKGVESPAAYVHSLLKYGEGL